MEKATTNVEKERQTYTTDASGDFESNLHNRILNNGLKLYTSILLSIVIIFMVGVFGVIFTCSYKFKGNAKKYLQNCSAIQNKTIVFKAAELNSLLCIDVSVEEVHIESVKTLFPKINIDIQKKLSVRHLIVSCELSENWLSILSKIFPLLEKITYKEDKLCKYPAQGENINGLPGYSFPSLTTLVIKKSSLQCRCSELILKLQTPLLQNLQILNSDVNLLFFKRLDAFLIRVKNAIEIEIVNSYMCNECDIFDIRGPKFVKVNIKNSRRVSY